MDTNAKNILFFDGVCHLCNNSIDFLIQRDYKRRLHFASLQGSTAQASLPEKLRNDLNTVVYLRNSKIYLRSDAILFALYDLGGFWSMSILARILPASLRDILYNLIAKNRYRWFGQRDTCRLPTAEEKNYFLD